MSELSAVTQTMTQHLRDFFYFPVTDWRDFFRPTFYFGCNVNDLDTEREVLGDVGSYGKQLNRLLDGVAVLIKIAEPRLAELPEEDQDAIWRLKALHKDATEASRRAERRRAS